MVLGSGPGFSYLASLFKEPSPKSTNTATSHPVVLDHEVPLKRKTGAGKTEGDWRNMGPR